MAPTKIQLKIPLLALDNLGQIGKHQTGMAEVPGSKLSSDRKASDWNGRKSQVQSPLEITFSLN